MIKHSAYSHILISFLTISVTNTLSISVQRIFSLFLTIYKILFFLKIDFISDKFEVVETLN